MSFLESLVSDFSNANVLVVGDLMLDRYIYGEANRISPEAPVPIIDITGEKYVLGGAANVAANVAALGGKAHLIGIIGKDDTGKRIKNIADEAGIRTSFYRSSKFQTTLKTRVVANKHQVIRLDKEESLVLSKSMKDKILTSINNALFSKGAIILSDYNKGIFCDSGFCYDLVSKLKSADSFNVFADPKPVNMDNFKGVDFISPNIEEALAMVKGDFNSSPEDPDFFKGLAARLQADYLVNDMAITCGEKGIYAYQGNAGTLLPAKAKEVYDVSGAGDTALAVIAMSHALGSDLNSACKLANVASGIVVGKVGTATLTQDELLDKLNDE